MSMYCTLSGIIRWSSQKTVRVDVSKILTYEINIRMFKLLDKDHNYEISITSYKNIHDVYHNHFDVLTLRYKTVSDAIHDVEKIQHITTQTQRSSDGKSYNKRQIMLK